MSRPELIRFVSALKEEGDVDATKERRKAAIEALAPLLGIEDRRGEFSAVIRLICDAAEKDAVGLAEALTLILYPEAA